MSSHTALIGMIVAMVVTAGSILVFSEITQSVQSKGNAIAQGENSKSDQGLVLVNTIGTNVQNDTFSYTKFQVRSESDEQLNLNDTFIQIRTDQSVADLQYRNGTAQRSEINGFYTK